jgi:short-subunit dehydrogenase
MVSLLAASRSRINATRNRSKSLERSGSTRAEARHPDRALSRRGGIGYKAPMFDTPKRALITGASSGIGAALATRLAARGTEIWLCARRKDKLAENVAAIVAAGGKAHAVELDVSDADATYAKLTALDAEVGGIDLAVANAGMGGAAAMHDVATMPWKNTRALFDTNLLGAAATLNAFIPGMVARGHGHLVGVSSIAGAFPLPRGAAYSASKAGLTLYLEAMDVELRAKGVPVTTVIPAFVRTPMAEGLDEPMPFMVELDKAIDIIDSGIQRRASRVQFPFEYSFIAGASNAIPRGLRNFAIRKALSMNRKTP